jgi:catechol 2,3-dioxygenase-like lactoylglutathione lyase family enzyme
MKLGMIMVFVSDLGEAKRFYSDVLGFPVKAQRTNYLELVNEKCDFIAFKCDRDAKVQDYSRVARSVFAFEVGSVEQSIRELRTKGVEFLHQEPAENEFSRYVAFADPFGNVHELYERKVESSSDQK